jgi:uncharacterized protein with FMN-binding domain
MKRAVIAAGASLVGVIWLLNFKPAPTVVNVTGANTGQAGYDPNAPQQPANPSPGASPSGASGTYTGQAADAFYGLVQVRVTVSNGKISDVQPLQLPSDRARSAYISQVAGPMLRTEALQAQSAKIDVISGATYTSDAYAQSLESALQQANLG